MKPGIKGKMTVECVNNFYIKFTVISNNSHIEFKHMIFPKITYRSDDRSEVIMTFDQKG